LKDQYTLEELLEDPSFHQYINYPYSPAAGKWHSWVQQHPEQHDTLRKARSLIEGIAFNKKQLSEKTVDAAWKQLGQRISHSSPVQQPAVLLVRRAYRVAAVVVLLLLAGTVWWVQHDQMQEIRAAYGETRQLTLADGTEVMLNANSTLRFQEKELLSKERKVYLEGEAYFRVQRTVGPQPASFAVISAAGGTIEVLGTEFNVFSREQTTRVVLEEGKVHFTAQKNSTELEPGDMVEYSRSSGEVRKKKVDARRYTSWKENRLYFDNTSMEELIDTLRTHYGVEVKILDPTIADKKLSGVIATNNLQSLLKALSLIFNIEISQKGNIIYMQSVNP